MPGHRHDWSRDTYSAHRGTAYDPRRDFESISGADLTADEIEFGRAMERWQRMSGERPTCRDVLTVAKELGYKRE